MITKTTKEVIWLCVASVMLIPRTSAQQYAQVTFPDNRVVPEDSPIGTLLVNITDSFPNDPDRNVSDVKYSGSDHAFYTQKVPGKAKWMVILNTALDYDRGQRDYRLPFQAISVTARPQDIILSIHLSDVNDNAPEFQNLPYNAAVDEDTKPGSTIDAQVHATDIDTGLGSKVTFELVDSRATGTTGMFSMNSSTGVLSLSAPLDYETRTFYHYTVIAKDKGTPSLSSTTDLFITVKDVQDSPPKFTNIPYVTSVDENTAMGTSVLTVRAVDQDQAIPNVVTYNFTNSNCPGLFEINPSSGVICVASQLDRESDLLLNNNGLCIISIQATEVNGIHRQEGNFTAAEKVTITVIDINDNPPTFSAASYTAAINENAPVNTPLQLNPPAIVSDLDQGTNSLINLHLLTESETFELVSSEVLSRGSVQLRVKNNTRLDYETRQYLTIQIYARDNHRYYAATTATVTVTLLNMNEFAPVFTSQGNKYEAVIEEGSGPGTSVITVRATDSDQGIYGNITYSLNNDRGLFQIDAVTGEVTVSSNQTDREREDSYYLVVAATDGGQLQQTAPLSITISDRNDNRPVFQRKQYDTVLEQNSRHFSRPVTVQAIDADKAYTANSNVTYAIRSVTPSSETGHFAVDTVTGRLRVTSPLDYDAITFPAGSAGQVTLVLVASDHGDPQLSAEVTVSVTLTSKGQWTDELADGSLKYACAGDSVRLPWNVTLSAGQTLEDIQWFYQGGSSQMIAVLSHGTFLPLPTFSNRVVFLPSSGIILSDVSVHDSGNYSVEVNGHGDTGAFFKIKRTVTLQVGENLTTTDGVLRVSENPVAVLDKSSGQWSVELQCGAFTYLGHPPFDVQWTTPTGHLSASSSYSGGQFRLLLPAPLTGGYYHCKIPLSAFTTACLASNSTQKGDANYKLDNTKSRLTLLEAHLNALQNENFRLKNADSDMAIRIHQMEAKWSKQVSFHARNLRNTSPQRDSPLIVDHVMLNQGGCYSATTGMFTAPANGTYFFIGSSGPLTAGQTGQLELREDGGGQQESLVSPRALSDQGVAASVQGVVHMQSGDRAWLQVSSPTAFSSATTSFTGFLVSPDP